MQERITDKDARYALDLVKAICAEVGPGLPGSSQERERAHMIRNELAAYLGAENVEMEEFAVAPRAFLGSMPVCAVCMLAAALINIFLGRLPAGFSLAAAAASLALAVFAALALMLEYLCYFEFLDRFSPKKHSVNVIGKLRKPGTPTVKRLLIVSGHHDSAWENTWIRLLGHGFYVTLPTIFLAIIVLLVMGMVELVSTIAGNGGGLWSRTLGWIMLFCPVLPAVVFAMFFTRGGKSGGVVPGAADNLSACAVTVALCRFLAHNPSYIPDDTEIRFITFGSEEAGLRGSRRYVERHLEELKRLDARLLNFETIAHPQITILTSDVNGVKNSVEMVRSVAAAAARAGVPHEVKPYPLGGGGSDAGSFSQAGLKAVTLLPLQVPRQLVGFYHQRRDTPEVLTMEPLQNVLKLAFEWVRGGRLTQPPKPAHKLIPENSRVESV